MDHILRISEFIFESFIHIWPYLLISIPLAVFVKLSGASNYIRKAFNRNPLISVFLATVIGAISPFCSCGVIPVITSLLIGGVPLAPVMSFWIASPSMDPEVFFLSVATIGWELSAWRLGATFVISLSAGIITHYLQTKGFFGQEFIRILKNGSVQSGLKKPAVSSKMVMQFALIRPKNTSVPETSCCVPVSRAPNKSEITQNCSCESERQNGIKIILQECYLALRNVITFMLLAFFINALITFYIPADFISNNLPIGSPLLIPVSALIGIPFYTSNITALPLVSGFLSMGMNAGAVLTFLIAGPVTTLPAMAAVWGIVKPKVFLVFLVFGLFGSIISGYLFNLLH